MPMPVPMPTLRMVLPGKEGMATSMMKSKMKAKGVASLEELRELCVEAEVRMVACQMTVDLFEFDTADFIDGIELGGAAAFFSLPASPILRFLFERMGGSRIKRDYIH